MRPVIKRIVKVGRRKKAAATAIIQAGTGKITINGYPIDHLDSFLRSLLERPLLLAGDLLQLVDIHIRVTGGGFISQEYAIATAITRSLARWFNDFLPERSMEFCQKIREFDRYLMICNHRQREPKKAGRKGARRMPQKSYR